MILGDGLYAVGNVEALRQGNIDILEILFFVGVKAARVFIFPKGADDFRIAAFDDSHHLRFVVASAVNPFGIYGIAVQRAVQIFMRNKKIVAVESLVFGDEKRKAAFVARKGAFDEAELLRRAVFSAARHVKGALVAEGIEKGQQALFFPMGTLRNFAISVKVFPDRVSFSKY